jgi:hypothetical protein
MISKTGKSRGGLEPFLPSFFTEVDFWTFAEVVKISWAALKSVGQRWAMAFDGYATAPARIRATENEAAETVSVGQNMARVIVYGPPGSGKTSVCKLISEKKGLVLPQTESPTPSRPGCHP